MLFIVNWYIARFEGFIYDICEYELEDSRYSKSSLQKLKQKRHFCTSLLPFLLIFTFFFSILQITINEIVENLLTFQFHMSRIAVNLKMFEVKFMTLSSSARRKKQREIDDERMKEVNCKVRMRWNVTGNKKFNLFAAVCGIWVEFWGKKIPN